MTDRASTIPRAVRRAPCHECGERIGYLHVGSYVLAVNLEPVSGVCEEFNAAGEVVGYGHRVVYRPHECAR